MKHAFKNIINFNSVSNWEAEANNEWKQKYKDPGC